MPRATAIVERDFVDMLRGSQLGMGVEGGVYRWAYRPKNSKAEDVCVKLVSGETTQIQTGVMAVAAFYGDRIAPDGSLVPDPDRGEQLEEMLMLFPLQTRQTAYRIELLGSPLHTKDPDTGQHFVSAKLKFKTLTE